MGEVDPAFIQHPEHRPKLSIIKAEGIPLIDLSAINSPNSISDPEDIERIVREVGNACKEWGFFQVINHGVSSDKLQKIEASAKKFFALPLEEKRKIRRDLNNVLGYYDTENTKNIRDWKEVFDFDVEDPTLVPASPDPEDDEETEWTNQWPASKIIQLYLKITTMEEIDQVYIKLPELSIIEVEGIPLIDLSPMNSPDSNFYLHL